MFKKALIASAMLVSAIGSNAAETASFGVAGGSAPPSCSVALANNGVADVGTFTNAQVKSFQPYNGNYLAPGNRIGLTVTCGSAIRAVISFTDNKPTTRFPLDGNDLIRFGLTDGSGSVGIGSYQIHIGDVLLDNVGAAGAIIAATGTSAWSTSFSSGLDSNYAAPGYSVGFIKTAGTLVPDQFTNLTANLDFGLFLSKTYMDSAINAVVFNGSGVITVHYI